MLKRTIALLSFTLLLSACGFQLRGTGDIKFALHEINVEGRDMLSPLAKDVVKRIEANKVQVTPNATYTLYLGREESSQYIASKTAGSRSAEYTIVSALNYEIYGPNKLPLLVDKVELERTYAYDSNNISGSDEERRVLAEEMRYDLVTQLAMRLQLITPEQLDRMERQAEQKAQAEKEAYERAQEMRRQQVAPQQSPIQFP
ncbi:LPS assembly lipoprotein LptE [Pseudomonas sp. F1_0610]|uniref:LPS-assembly lipoprotein LptE n=1 Tax=Pseudomonas sp. F1_0610 TaxID=3114284 RepID=UPI0039C0F2F5